MTVTLLRAQYEASVRALRPLAEVMRSQGVPPEAIARALHAERRRLAGVFKDRTPEPMRTWIYSRTLAVYGDPLGPRIEDLRAKGKSWDAIIESAAQPGRSVVGTPRPRQSCGH
jgi:hypothetical protein